MGRPKKNKLEDLDEAYRTTVDSKSDEEIRQELAKVAIDEHENRQNKDLDQDLAEQKAKYQQAGEVYKEASKANKLRTSYCYNVLEARGKV